MATSPQTVPVSTLAALLCVTERRVQQLEKDKVVKKAAHGQYELVPSVQGYIKFLQQEAQDGLAGSKEFKESKTRQAAAKAELEEIKVQRLRGELIHSPDIAEALSQVFSVFRTRIRAIPSKAAPQARMARTDGEAQEILRQYTDEALQELSEGIVKVTPRPGRDGKPQNPDRDDPGAGGAAPETND